MIRRAPQKWLYIFLGFVLLLSAMVIASWWLTQGYGPRLARWTEEALEKAAGRPVRVKKVVFGVST